MRRDETERRLIDKLFSNEPDLMPRKRSAATSAEVDDATSRSQSRGRLPTATEIQATDEVQEL